MCNKRLFWRLFASYLWAPVLVLLLIGLYGSGVARHFYEDHLKADLEARARLAAKPIDALLMKNQADQVDNLCKELGESTRTRITAVLPSGQVIGDSKETPRDMDSHLLRPEIQEALAGRVGRSLRFSSTEQMDQLYVAVPILHGGETAAAIRASVPSTALEQAISIVRNRLLIAGFLGVLLQAAISLVISRRISRPLEQIKIGADRFAAGELNHRLPITGGIEICAVAEALNHMAEQLDERIQTVLRQQNEREAMLSSMEEGVLAIDKEGIILSLNKTCATLLGGEPDKLEGRSIYEVIRKPDLLSFVESALTSSSPVEGEIPIRGANNRWVSAHGAALHDSQRGKIGVLIVLHDITRLRHLEDVRRDFVANVSHELRTPITSIKGFIETLLEGALEDKDNADRFLQIMLRQVNRLDAIINDLLALSRIEKAVDEPMIELSLDSIRGVLEAAVEMCERKASQKQIKFELICPESITARINAALIEQAVVNLLDNAVKYSAANSTVTLSATRQENELLICVKDQGCGIEAKHLPRLFERFYRVDMARSRELGGTGLGLAIVRHIALAHRGSVTVESTVGVGSTFCLRLPIAAP